ncbi:hypothetical protein K493DRAFT_336913 [Basidiobolus meristosporus CBS 931.73]|uniref:Uncharacterized protein n=1 Tax=Basidiobolus meristosporus CBS 931.73 TaxID=1314790 RepID=A0A1Y1YES6_9FUNG|nr:hypothetical protein K493DRAFT_336913 [Basidiobolus meristosporus CBS 931.73]|eukprot:ORX96458.1 hypothetical protein K493DRAFT_336913 [Basidiobolus meristosporus CBS 931.73]
MVKGTFQWDSDGQDDNISHTHSAAACFLEAESLNFYGWLWTFDTSCSENRVYPLGQKRGLMEYDVIDVTYDVCLEASVVSGMQSLEVTGERRYVTAWTSLIDWHTLLNTATETMVMLPEVRLAVLLSWWTSFPGLQSYRSNISD